MTIFTRMTWLDSIIEALRDLNNEAYLYEIYKQVEVVRKRHNLKLNSSSEATIRGVIEHYSSDSKLYTGKADVFKRVSSGRWGLRDNYKR